MMIEDIKQFYKYYKLYKKGKEEMEKIKNFISDHQKEILIGVGFVISYQFGFKRGFRTGIKFEDALIRLTGEKK